MPRLRDIFRKEEIEYLLTDSIKCMRKKYQKAKELFNFVIRTGYKDKPEVDEDNKLLHRMTPVHHVVAHDGRDDLRSYIACELILNVYDRLDVVYSSRLGMTHFHVACYTGCLDMVEKFLDSSRDPNHPVGGTGDTPLIFALQPNNAGLVDSLLRRGADPNLANAKGLTPLHVICKDGGSLEEFFKINDDIGLTVQIDPRDKLGRTPLQGAMSFDLVWHKNAMIRENLSLYDLIQLRSKEALRLVTFEDLRSLRRWTGYGSISLRDRETCAANLCEHLSRGFLKRWALEPFMELIHNRLPILCCEMIIDDLSNEDLFNICQATAAMRTKRKPNGKKSVATNVTTTANKRPVKAKKAPKRLQHK
uniref:Uncharacterized protein n=1 Tax=Trichogramma kaykai TaxID=54128 RepID=A0ABD2XAS8_9HYME